MLITSDIINLPIQSWTKSSAPKFLNRSLNFQLHLEQSSSQAYSASQSMALRRQIAALEDRHHEFTKATIRRTQMEREIETESTRHQQVVGQLANLDSRIDVLDPSARIIANASPISAYQTPPRTLIVAVSGIGALLVILTLVLLLEGLNTRIYTIEVFRQLSSAPNLGIVPHFPRAFRKPYRSLAQYIKTHPMSSLSE